VIRNLTIADDFGGGLRYDARKIDRAAVAP
jgi:hypothetical protein